MLHGTRFSRAPCSRTSARVVLRGAARVSRPSLCMVSSQTERRNGSIHGQPPGNRLDARTASGFARDTKLDAYSRRSNRATFVCTARRRRHRGLASACALRPRFHANSGQHVLLNRRSWSKSITCKSFPERKKMSQRFQKRGPKSI